MTTCPPLFIITAAVLLCGAVTGEAGLSICFQYTCYFDATLLRLSLADAQEIIRNFQANKNSTHITFSWDIVDGYYSSSYISNFRIYYRERPHTGSSYIGTISYSNSNLIKIGTSFQYTTTVTSFSNFGQYVMWVRVYRPSLTPSYAYSDQIYVEVGRSMPTCRRCMTALVAVLHSAHILPILL